MFQLRVIGYFEALSDERSRMELFEAIDDLFVNGLEKRRRIMS